MPEQLLPVLERVARVLNDRGIKYALIGGLAMALRGPIRATRDIDLLLKVTQLELPGLLEALAQQGFDIDVAATVRGWSQNHMMDFHSGSIRLDCLKPVLPAFEHVLNRARWEQVGSHPLRVVDGEGLIC